MGKTQSGTTLDNTSQIRIRYSLSDSRAQKSTFFMKFSQTFLFSIAAGSPQRVRRQNDQLPEDFPELSATIDPTDLSTTESFNYEDMLLNFQTSPDPFAIFDFLETTKDPIFEELIFTTPQTVIESDILATTESIDALLATEPVRHCRIYSSLSINVLLF